jgi:hypothetical protein
MANPLPASTGPDLLVEVTAPIDVPVTIPPGHIFEHQQFNGVQTLATSRPASFVVGPGQSRTLALPAWCLNHELNPPAGQPVTSTPLRCHYPAGTIQHAVWADRRRIMAVGATPPAVPPA